MAETLGVGGLAAEITGRRRRLLATGLEGIGAEFSPSREERGAVLGAEMEEASALRPLDPTERTTFRSILGELQKLGAGPGWTPEQVEELAATGTARSYTAARDYLKQLQDSRLAAAQIRATASGAASQARQPTIAEIIAEAEDATRKELTAYALTEESKKRPLKEADFVFGTARRLAGTVPQQVPATVGLLNSLGKAQQTQGDAGVVAKAQAILADPDARRAMAADPYALKVLTAIVTVQGTPESGFLPGGGFTGAAAGAGLGALAGPAGAIVGGIAGGIAGRAAKKKKAVPPTLPRL